MTERHVELAATTEGLPIAPALSPALQAAHVPIQASLVNGRVLAICGLAVALGLAAGGLAEILKRLIGFFTNLSFYGRLGTAPVSPAAGADHLGWWVVVIPALGGLVVGFLARYGSQAIRGHGIPEAMEQVLRNKSRIPARMTWLKPLSAAIAIGTGGPFGAEGPIIATGGALGSVLGQLLRTTPDERKTLLASGAAAGMAATFGSPVSAVLLAVELLLFEFRPRSIIPVALASVTATGMHMAWEGAAPVFAMPDLQQPSGGALVAYVLLGGIMGVLATLVTRAVYLVEDGFDRLPIHWMWWPALGGLAVGLIGHFVPLTLGVGYDNITHLLASNWSLAFVAILCVAKLTSWALALGSGTSGGTLAPLFTIGGALGALLGAGGAALAPGAGIDVRVAALVGMAALFAGASRALLASVVFAFETTLQPMGLLPLLGGCVMSYLISCLLMRHTIMTEKIARRGIRVPAEYSADFLDSLTVKDAATRSVIALPAERSLLEVRAWLTSGEEGANHQGFPIIESSGQLVGVLTRRDLLNPAHDGLRQLRELVHRTPVVAYEDSTLREAADQMARHDVGRLPVLARPSGRLLGIVTRSDILGAHRHRLHESHTAETPTLSIPTLASLQPKT